MIRTLGTSPPRPIPARQLGALAVVVGLATATLSGAGSASAQSRPPVVPGDAVAVAKAFTFGVGLNGPLGSSSNLQMTRGLSSSDARDTTSTAKGQVLDMGLLSTFNRQPTGDCPPFTPLWRPGTAPPVSAAESSDPASATPRPVTVLFPGELDTPRPEAGVQDAIAGPGTTSGANTGITLADGGFMTAKNLRSETKTFLDGAGVRSASSVVTADSIEVAGWFTLAKPRFAAAAVTGSPSTASFTFDSITFLGITTTGPAAQQVLTDAKNFVEGLFAGLGLKIDLPVVSGAGEVRSNPSRDTTVLEEVSVSPLRVKLANIPLSRDLLGPLIRSIQPGLLDELNAYLLENPCEDQTASNTVGITLGILSGEGELGTSIGQVKASTSDRWVAPPPPRPAVTTAPPTSAPLGAVTPVAEVPEVLPSATARGNSSEASFVRSTTGSNNGGSTVDTEPPPDSLPPPTTVADDSGGSGPIEVAKPTRVEVAAVSLRRGGVLVWAGLVLLVGVLCMAFGDRLVLSRRRNA